MHWSTETSITVIFNKLPPPHFYSSLGVEDAALLVRNWVQWRRKMQSSKLIRPLLSIPSPQGMINFAWTASSDSVNATVSVSVLNGQSLHVCLPRAGRSGAAPGDPKNDMLFVNGAQVAGEVLGRMLCAPNMLPEGFYTVTRLAGKA